jgi:hypothetical protein
MKTGYKRIVPIPVSTKKGETQPTRWKIESYFDHPSITGGACLNWQGAGFAYNPDNSPTPYNVTASLLRSDYSPETHQGNKLDEAGFVPYIYNTTPPPNPGEVVLRGKGMGEMTAHARRTRNETAPVWFQWKGERTATERDLIRAQIEPALKAYIDSHAAELHAEAVAKWKDACADAIKNARASLIKLETEAAAKAANL